MASGCVRIVSEAVAFATKEMFVTDLKEITMLLAAFQTE